MKRILFLLAAVITAGSISAYAQMSNKEIELMAGEAASEMAIEGWKAKVGSKPLKYQLMKSYTMQEEMENGQNKYILADGQVKGATFETARVHAMEVAKRNMISLIDNMSISETGGDMINVNGVEGAESEDLSETKYRNASSLDLGYLSTVMVCYRVPEEGVVEVLVQIAVTRENVIKAKLRRTRDRQNDKQLQNSVPKIEASHTL